MIKLDFVIRFIRNFVNSLFGTVTFKIKMLPGCEDLVPERMFSGDSGYDLFSAEDIVIPPSEIRLVNAGFSCEVPKGYELQIRPKSGLALKHYLTVANTPGTVDSNYRGTVKVILYNFGKNEYKVNRKQKIAQGVICKIPSTNIRVVDSLSTTDRNNGGFGSTGLNKNT